MSLFCGCVMASAEKTTLTKKKEKPLEFWISNLFFLLSFNLPKGVTPWLVAWMSPQKVKLLVIVALLWWCLQRVPYQQVYHCCTREAHSASVRCLQTGLWTRGEGYGVGGYWGEVNLASSLHWQGNESASHGFEFGRACSGTVSQRGNGLCRRASRSLADLTPRSAGASPSPGGQTRGLPRALTERDWSRLFLYYFYLFRLLGFHCPSLIFTHCLYFMYNSLWCLKLLFIPLSEMYNFVSHFE